CARYSYRGTEDW
nr:immunoglobulin heavy chain junction region [Mus musculus]MBK4197373.1 immunoglobulin heavy chain junction region [Mus musculus]MBK4197374.1 immunoglobulin heavy chain junction region [Mus musculus]MBK4197375.1 immunoglobulin heavy chain junction region [Mus musculus]